MSMITAAAWVPRGAPAQNPRRAEFNEEEFARIQELAAGQLAAAKADLTEARAKGAEEAAAAVSGKSKSKSKSSKKKAAAEEDDDDLREYDLEHYDDSEPEADGNNDENSADALGIFGNVKNLVYHASNDDDPYVTLKDDDGSDSEREELEILPSDNMILAARIEDEVAHLEVYVYEDEADNLYVHHDVMLPAVPLCVEWVRSNLGDNATPGNYAAVGTMDPDIELWDLDVVDSMYPDLILGAGGNNETDSKKRRKKKSSKAVATHHTDAVLSLASNRNRSNLLASASADCTVKLWDLSGNTPSVAAASFDHHSDKVCSVAWHPTEFSALLSGSYDKTVQAGDLRLAGAAGRRSWTVDSDVENVAWDPHDANQFYVSTEGGVVYCFDARTATGAGAAPLWRLHAHDASVSALAVNAHIKGYLATGAADKSVKLWRTEGGKPSMVASKQVPDTGRVFAAGFGPDAAVAYRLALAGSKGGLQVWDTSTNRGVRAAFAYAPVSARGGPVADDDVVERMTGVRIDDDDDESGESGDEEEDGVPVDGEEWEDDGDSDDPAVTSDMERG